MQAMFFDVFSYQIIFFYYQHLKEHKMIENFSSCPTDLKMSAPNCPPPALEQRIIGHKAK